GRAVPAKGDEAPGRVRSSPGRRKADGPAQGLRRPARKFRDCGYLANRLPRSVSPGAQRCDQPRAARSVSEHAPPLVRGASGTTAMILIEAPVFGGLGSAKLP